MDGVLCPYGCWKWIIGESGEWWPINAHACKGKISRSIDFIYQARGWNRILMMSFLGVSVTAFKYRASCLMLQQVYRPATSENSHDSKRPVVSVNSVVQPFCSNVQPCPGAYLCLDVPIPPSLRTLSQYFHDFTNFHKLYHTCICGSAVFGGVWTRRTGPAVRSVPV